MSGIEAEDDPFLPPRLWRGTAFHYLVRYLVDGTATDPRVVRFDRERGSYTEVVPSQPPVSDLRRYGFQWIAPVPSPRRCRRLADRSSRGVVREPA